jgi:hypothetical protein
METRVISLPCRFGFIVCFLHSVGIHQGINYLQKSLNLFPSDLCLEYSQVLRRLTTHSVEF